MGLILWPRWVLARIGVTRSTQAWFLAADRQCTELPLLRGCEHCRRDFFLSYPVPIRRNSHDARHGGARLRPPRLRPTSLQRKRYLCAERPSSCTWRIRHSRGCPSKYVRTCMQTTNMKGHRSLGRPTQAHPKGVAAVELRPHPAHIGGGRHLRRSAVIMSHGLAEFCRG